MIEDVIAFISHPEFQNTNGGYIWDNKRRYGAAAGRVFLATVNSISRLVVFLEAAAPFKSARKSEWFTNGIQQLERFRVTAGTYRFPSNYLMEKRNSYYLYQGAHMGLGENRRFRRALEIESTFRMLRIKKRMTTQTRY